MRRRSHSRRAFLRAASAAGAGALAGCPAGLRSGSRAAVSILAAGSLQHALEHGLKPAVDVPVRIEARGSATLARLIAEGRRDPDIVTVADTALLEAPLSPPWYAAFASNALVLAYDPGTDGGQRLADAGPDRWYRPLVDGVVRLGRTDPDRDPLGYRTLFAFDLATRFYDDAPDLREAVLRRDQVYPETALVGQFETGSIDAAVVYRNMAVERGYAYLDLPGQLNLSDPTYADDWYSTVAYELPGGRVIEGGTVAYGSTIRTTSDAARSVFAVQTAGTFLAEAGFTLREGFPRYEGDAPRAVVDRSPAGSGSGTTV